MLRLTPLFVLAITGCGVAARPGSEPLTSAQPALDYPVGEFSLTERSGEKVTDRDLRGSTWVASFVFTRCTGPCPQVTATVARLQEELKDVLGVKFVTFTVDPTHDDHVKLREYAKHFNADPKRWLFLTGDEATIHKLMREQFKQAIQHNAGENVPAGEAFGHSTRLLVVDREGVIRASFDGLPNEKFEDSKERFEANLKALKERVRELAR